MEHSEFNNKHMEIIWLTFNEMLSATNPTKIQQLFLTLMAKTAEIDLEDRLQEEKEKEKTSNAIYYDEKKRREESSETERLLLIAKLDDLKHMKSLLIDKIAQLNAQKKLLLNNLEAEKQDITKNFSAKLATELQLLSSQKDNELSSVHESTAMEESKFIEELSLMRVGRDQTAHAETSESLETLKQELKENLAKLDAQLQEIQNSIPASLKAFFEEYDEDLEQKYAHITDPHDRHFEIANEIDNIITKLQSSNKRVENYDARIEALQILQRKHFTMQRQEYMIQKFAKTESKMLSDLETQKNGFMSDYNTAIEKQKAQTVLILSQKIAILNQKYDEQSKQKENSIQQQIQYEMTIVEAIYTPKISELEAKTLEAKQMLESVEIHIVKLEASIPHKQQQRSSSYQPPDPSVEPTNAQTPLHNNKQQFEME